MNDLFATAGLPPSFGSKGYTAQPHPCGKGVVIVVDDGELVYIPQFIDKRIADRTMDVLLANNLYNWKTTDWSHLKDISPIVWENIQWKQDSIKMFGKQHALPRLTAWYGDAGKTYTYSGIFSSPIAWTTPLLWLRQQLMTVSDVAFNSVLLNWYRDGQDYLSWHDDAEPELGDNPTIGSLNFGQPRRFLLRRKDDHSNRIELLLGHGDLLVMSGALQQHWQHSVPKQAAVKGSRINLTFRKILGE